LTITGDGNGANATLGINNISNTVNTITLSSYGSGYTYADGQISGGGGSGATVKVILSPPGGHGSDAISELGGSNIILNPRVQNSESGVLSTNNDIRQIALISNPLIYSQSNLMSNTAFSQTFDLILSNYGSNYIEDEIVYQGASYANSSFSGRVLEWNAANLKIKLINTKGTIGSSPLIGSNSIASRFVTSASETPDCQPYSGKIIYIENISPITRSPSQTEDYKIIISF
jgi:hypothetical protein